MDEKLYKLTVGLFLKNNAAAGLRQFKKDAEGAEKSTKGLQKELERAKKLEAEIAKARGGVGAFDKAIAGQIKINKLAADQAAIKIKSATETDRAAQKALNLQLKAMGLVKSEVNAKTQELAIVERIAARQAVAASKQEAGIARELRAAAMRQAAAEKLAVRQQAAADRLAAQQQRAAERQQRAQVLLEERQQRAQARLAMQAQRDADRIMQQQMRNDRRIADARAARVQQELNSILARRQAAYAASEERAGSRGAAFGTAGFIAASAAAAGSKWALHEGLTGAGTLETNMVTIRNATGASQAQQNKLYEIILEAANQTSMDVVDAAQSAAVAARSGINDPQKLIGIMPAIAQFADIQHRSRGVGFEDATKQAIKIAHQFGRFAPGNGPGGIEPIFEGISKVSMMMPDGLDKYLTQAGYYMSTFKRFGVKDDEAMMAGAFLDRMGLGQGKGGTGLQNFLMQQMQALALTQHVQGGRKTALDKLGLLNKDGSSKYYNNGHFDIFGSLGAINNAVAKRTAGLTGHKKDVATQQAVTDIQKALGIQGGRIGFLGTPEAVAQLGEMMNQFKHLPDMAKMQLRYNDTLMGRFEQFNSNVSSLLVEAFYPWLDGLKNMFKGLADGANAIQKWMHNNKEWAAATGLAISVAFATASVIVAKQLWGVSSALISLGTNAGIVAAELRAAGLATGAAGAAGAAGAGAAGGARAAIAAAAGVAVPALALTTMNSSDLQRGSGRHEAHGVPKPKPALNALVESVWDHIHPHEDTKPNFIRPKTNAGPAKGHHTSHVDAKKVSINIHGAGKNAHEIAREVAAVLRDQAQRSRGNHSPGPSLSSYQFA